MLGITELHRFTDHRHGVGERSLAAGRTDDPPVETHHAGPEGLVAACEQSALQEGGAAAVRVRSGEHEGPEAVLRDRSVGDRPCECRVRLRRQPPVGVSEIDLTREGQGTHGVDVVSNRQIAKEHHGVGEGARGAVGRSDGPPGERHRPRSERAVATGAQHPAGERRSSRVGIAAGEREDTAASLRQPCPTTDFSAERRLGVDREGPRFPGVAQIGRAREEHRAVVAAIAEGNVAVDRNVVGKCAGGRGSAGIRGNRRGGRAPQGQRTGAEGRIVRGKQRSLGERGATGVGVDPGERQSGSS